MGIFNKIFGDANEKVIKLLQPLVDQINGLEEKFVRMNDEELKGMTEEFRGKIAAAGSAGPDINNQLDELLPEAFAVVREAAKRVLRQRHYDVQLIGGIVLHRGQIAEMKTGEGKTLVATLPLYLNGLSGRGVHLVTVNDYLSRLGAGWMAPVYHALGMTTGVIIHDSALIYDPEYSDDRQYDDRLKHFRQVSRAEAYNCDIVYGTNNEFGFDYLRDNMVPSLERMVQRRLNYAIVDEVDSILIDEARTPLIISAPAEESTDKYYKFSQLVERLQENEDYNVDEKMRAATLTEAGIAKMEKWLGVDNIYQSGGVREVHHIEQALKARVLFKRDRDYVVNEGQVIIVDEFTGRLMHGRRYSEGLHQAIEAKEGVKIQRESQTLATITFQNYFRMYHRLSGMTGTAVTEAEEFAKIYNLETVVIPTNKPMVRQDLNDLIYRSEAGKFRAVIAEIKRRHQTGQPVLVGTISIEKNELLGELLARQGVKAQILNAKHHEQEARIITQAGKLGAVTIATNMAGRGVDIILGGQTSAPTPLVAGEGSPTAESDQDYQTEQEKVKQLGGLHVIGTERHEARRIDNQLRGRAGRQGDPGSSQFYVSMEDDLMRIFGGDRMKKIMTTLRLPEDTPVENRLVSKSIESAQRKVEGNNFDIRKHLVEYDDVINKHREAIYKKRREILELANQTADGRSDKPQTTNHPPTPRLRRAGKQISNPDGQNLKNNHTVNSVSDIILEMVASEIEQVISLHTAADSVKDWNLEEIYQVVATIFPVEEKLKTDLLKLISDGGKLDKAKARTAVIEQLEQLAARKYLELVERSGQAGINWSEVAKAVLIRTIDLLWVEHLEAMDYLRRGIGLRGYGQRDPLVEYKKEAYRLYNELQNLIQKQLVYSIYKVADLTQFAAPSLADRASRFSAPAKVMNSETSSFSGFKQTGEGNGSSTADNISFGKLRAGSTAEDTEAVREKAKDAAGNKVGRNDPCPCGSGKKYKRCHGA